MEQFKDDFFMSLALEEAKKAFEKQEVPVGAVIAQEGRVLSQSHNFREGQQNPLGHAELLAIEKASKELNSWRLEGCKIYVTLEPCLMCIGAILQARLSHLIYASSDPKAGFSSKYALDNQRTWTHKLKITSGFCSDESSKLLKQFFQKLRK